MNGAATREMGISNMDDFKQLARECEEQMWRPDDRLPDVADQFSGRTPPPRVAPSPQTQLDQVLKTLAAVCRVIDGEN